MQPQSLIRFKKHGAREGKQAEEAELAVCAKGPPRLAKITPPLRRGAVSSLEPPRGEGEQGGWGPGLCVRMQVPQDVWDSLQHGTPRTLPP